MTLKVLFATAALLVSGPALAGQSGHREARGSPSHSASRSEGSHRSSARHNSGTTARGAHQPSRPSGHAYSASATHRGVVDAHHGRGHYVAPHANHHDGCGHRWEPAYWDGHAWVPGIWISVH